MKNKLIYDDSLKADEKIFPLKIERAGLNQLFGGY